MACDKEYIVSLDSVDSTNRFIRDEALALQERLVHKGFVVVTAKHQTAGRGQRGNVWSSNAGENLLLSILVRPECSLQVCNQFLLSQAVAVALHDTMLCHDIDTRLKWPNDIYVGNRKLAGILVELDYSGMFVEQAIIGVGVNVNQVLFPPMDRTPVSMKMLKGSDFVVEDVLETFLDFFNRYYSEICIGNKEIIVDKYTKLLVGLHERCSFIDSNGLFDAVIEGVENSGYLLVRRDNGILSRYAFKEIEQLL